MKMTYISRLYTYHRKYSWLYLILVVTIYAVYFFHLPTPLSLILSPLGLRSWSVGLTRASIKLFRLDFIGAYRQNPLIYLVIVGVLFQLFVMPLLEKNHRAVEK